MRRRALLAALPLMASCAPLGAFDALAPRDGGTRRVARDIAYGANPKQRLDLYAPTSAAAPLPVLVFIHGGSWANGDRRDYEFLGAAFAAQGFLTVLPSYRLVPEVRFPDFVYDCAEAVSWVARHASAYGGDGGRMVLVGHSAGAYNATMLGLDAHYLQSAGVDMHAIRGVVGLAGPYDFLPFDVDATRNAFGQASDPQLTQPIHFARADAPPLFLLWGEEDHLVGRRSIEGLAAAMRSAGGPVETKLYPDLDHAGILLALSRPFRDRAPVLADVTAFARRVTA